MKTYRGIITGGKTYCTIDIAKLFFALCIVILHGGGYTAIQTPFDYYAEKIILRAAVPFFFVCSGYFLKSHLDKGKGIKSYCVRLLKPLLFFEAINVLIYVIEAVAENKDAVSIGKAVVKHVLFYPYGALWYLQACIVGAVILYLFYIRNRTGIAVTIGFALYGFALICNNYYFVISGNSTIKLIVDVYMDVFISARNGIFVGLFYLAIGFLLHNNKLGTVIEKTSFLLFSFALYFVEVFLLYGKEYIDDGALYLTHAVFVPSLFAFLCRHSINIPEKMSVTVRNYSTGIYLLHRIFLSLYGIFFAWVGYAPDEINLCLIVLISCATVCTIVYRLKCEPMYSLLR